MTRQKLDCEMISTCIQKSRPRTKQKSKIKTSTGKRNERKSDAETTADQDRDDIKASLSSIMESLDRRMEDAVLSTRRRKSSLIRRQEPNSSAQNLTSPHRRQISRNLNRAKEKEVLKSVKSDECNTRDCTFRTKTKKKVHNRNETSRRATRARMVDTKKRRQDIEKERMQHLQLNSGQARQQRLKEKSGEKKRKQDKVKNWMVCVELGMRVQLAINTVSKFRAYQRQLLTEDAAARVITRQLRAFKFTRYRKRIKGALFVLSSIFVMKVKLWKKRKKIRASDTIRAFLVSLDDANKESGGCLALIVKGKKWRVYRQKIVVLQKLWRSRMCIIQAQAKLVDTQWRREQDLRTEQYVEALYNSLVEEAIKENEKIDSVNRTRKLIKLRPFPRKQQANRSEIKRNIMKGDDLLSVYHICPKEIRLSLIKSTLRYLRLNQLTQLEMYEKHLDQYNMEMQNIQQRRAVLVGFSGSKVANSWIKVEHNERHLMALGGRTKPKKPKCSIILGQMALNKLIDTGESCVKVIRDAWKPSSMKIPDVNLTGKQVAEVHLNEIEKQGFSK